MSLGLEISTFSSYKNRAQYAFYTIYHLSQIKENVLQKRFNNIILYALKGKHTLAEILIS